jgi:branched-chain amino acid transport system permease protein
MVYGVLRVLHVAHAGIYALGAYTGVVAFRLLGNFWLSLAVAMVVCAVVGVLVERLLYAPLLHLPRIVPLIGSIGLFIAMEEAFRIVAGPYALAYDAETHFPALSAGPLRLSAPQTLILTVTLGLLGLLWLLLSRSTVGLSMRATAMDADTTSTFGVNTRLMVTLNFVIGSALAGAAGVLIGVYDNQVWPTMGSIPAYKCLAIVVLGGLGNIPGSVLASFLIGGDAPDRGGGHPVPARRPGVRGHDPGPHVPPPRTAGKGMKKSRQRQRYPTAASLPLSLSLSLSLLVMRSC